MKSIAVLFFLVIALVYVDGLGLTPLYRYKYRHDPQTHYYNTSASKMKACVSGELASYSYLSEGIACIVETKITGLC